MSAARIAWSLWALALGLAAAGLLFGVLAFRAELPEGRGPLLASVVVLDVLLVLYGTLGALISSRRPENPIGWLFCAMALALGLLSAAYGYADYALYASESPLPGAVLAAWVTNWLPIAAVYVPACFLFLLFPDGRPASPRWRPVIWTLAVVAAVTILASALEPRIFTFPTVENPLGLGESVARTASVANELTNFTAIPAFLVSLASMIVRLRRARGRERLQLKWVAYAAALTATSFAAAFVAGSLTNYRGASDAFFLLGVVGFASIPVAAGVAILRHRLYDIDRLINRTLVYGALTILLALVYFAGVAALQAILRSSTGSESQLAVVASTLAIAALFNPLRRRVQGFIDRRFYRNKYDARKTLEAFSSTLRDEVDLDRLAAELVEVARQTMRPAHAALWLREAAASPRGPASGEDREGG